MADKQSQPSSQCQSWHRHALAAAQHRVPSPGCYCTPACWHVCAASDHPSPTTGLCATRKEGTGITETHRQGILTTLYKEPFIPTVPKIATGCNHEMNTWLWILLNHCLLAQTRKQCPAVASSPIVPVLNPAIKCWPFLSHPVLGPSFLKAFQCLKISWEI